jgi:hypothetical protein
MSDPKKANPSSRTLALGNALLGRPLVIQHSRLAGFRHHAAPDSWPALRPGSPLTLSAEADNPHDPQAVAIYWRGRKLGYLPRAENLVAARLLARRRPLGGRIRRLLPKADHDQRLQIEVLLL